jgi:hypothetical protein
MISAKPVWFDVFQPSFQPPNEFRLSFFIFGVVGHADCRKKLKI